MAKYTDNPYSTFRGTTALEPHRLVLVASTGKVGYAANAGQFSGSTQDRAVSADDPVKVKLRAGSGTHILTASGAITRGALVHTDANGKVTATVTAVLVGQALEAATADGDQIEVLVF